MELVERSCTYNKCTSIFMVLPHDKQECCSRVCHEKAGIISSRKTQGELLFATKRYRSHLSKAKEEQMERFGTMARGEQQRALKKESNQKEKRVKPTSINKEKIITQENEEKIQGTDKKILIDQKSITEKTKAKKLKEEQNTNKKTEIKKTERPENGTIKTREKSLSKSNEEGSGEIQPLDSNHVLIRIEEERSSTVSLLTDSSKHLIDLGKSLAAPRMDDMKEPIQMAPSHNVEVAIRCFSEARNMMKTKLEYLKLAKEICNGNN